MGIVRSNSGALEQPCFSFDVSSIENTGGGETSPPVAQAYKGARKSRQILILRPLMGA
jgi:hypothetical protein